MRGVPPGGLGEEATHGGGNIAGCLATAALPGARHLGDIVALEGGSGGGEGIADVPAPVTTRSLLAGEG